ISMYATRIAETLGLDADSTENLRTAALLRNVNELGISNDILYKAANLSEEEIEQGLQKLGQANSKAEAMGGSLRRAIPVLVGAQQLRKADVNPSDSSVEVQILSLAEKFEEVTNASSAGKMSPAQAAEAISKEFGAKYDSMIADAFVRAFGQCAQSAGA